VLYFPFSETPPKSESKLDGKEKEIKTLLDKKIPKASIAKIMDVSRTNLVHFVESRGID
jgi:helix-turn-helix protein